MEFEEAFAATNPDPAAYGIPPEAADADVQLRERRTKAAQNLLAGVAANEAYWNSRSPLEALAARAGGHMSIGVPPDHPDTATSEVSAGGGGAIETTATDGQHVPPSPDNPTEAVAKLRAQLEAAGISPDA